MKASELKTEIETLINLHGDLPVVIMATPAADDGQFPLASVATCHRDDEAETAYQFLLCDETAADAFHN